MPRHVFGEIRKLLWEQADQDDWTTLNDSDKTKFYEQWARDEKVGGVLARYMDEGKVRVYLKDTVMKPYGRARSEDPTPILRKLAIPLNEFANEQFEKPHGRLFHDGRVVCWGRARNWKDVIMAVYERAKRSGNRPYAAVLTHPSGATGQASEREIIADAASRLGIERLEWLDE
jgi:hypothetical protein